MSGSCKIIIGKHGAGKSNWIYNYFFCNAINKETSRVYLDKKFYLVVPEQDTNDKQRLMMKYMEEHVGKAGIINIDVVSFDRIAHNVFDILNIEPETENIIDDDAKTMILSLVLSRLGRENKLKYYTRMVNKVGFAKKLTQVVSEFYSYNITNENIERVIKHEANDKIFCNKLFDLMLIYDEFKKSIISKHFTIKEDKYDLLNKNIEKVDIFDGAVVAFDGFTGFTPVQLDIFKKIRDKADEVFVTVDLREDDKTDVFDLSKKFIKDIDSNDIVKVESDIKFKNKADFAHIEKYLFSYDFNLSRIKSDNISIYAAKNVDDEVKNVIDQIKKIIINNDYRYSDIKIVVPSIEEYSDKLIKSFNKENIPIFIDDTAGLLNSPYIETIRAAIDVVIFDFSYDSVMRYINAGLIEKNEYINMLDNVILKYGLRGYKRYKYGFDKLKINDKYKTNIIEIKDNIFKPLFSLYEKAKDNNTATAYISYIKDFIENIGLKDKFAVFFDAFNNNMKDDNDYKREQAILEESEKVVDKTLNNILLINNNDNEKVSLMDFKKLLDVGFTEKGIRSIPYLLDQVVVGDLMRSRFDNPKVEFFLGMNQSKIPASSSDVSLIDDKMRNKFSEENIPLSQTTEETTLNQRFYLYLALTNATEKMILSYPRLNVSGDSDEKSSVIIDIEKMFDGLNEEVIVYDTENENKPIMIDNKDLDANLATRLVNRDGKEFVGSVSSIECYNSCPYKFFLERSMSLKEREVYDIKPLDVGDYFHKILEIVYSESIDNSKLSDEKYIEEIIDAAILKIEREEKSQVDKFFDLNKNDKNFYGVNKLEFIKLRAKKVLITAIKMLQKIQDGSKLKCNEIENVFKLDIDGNKFTGKIDRIETYEDNGKTYVNILDYKSGKKEISIDDINAGVQIQLLIYLDYCLNDKYKGKSGAISCGSFYFRMADPVIKLDKLGDIEKLDNLKKEEFSYVGILNDDSESLEKIKPNLSPHVISRGENKGKVSSYDDGNGFSISGAILNKEKLDDMFENVHKKVGESIHAIKDGHIKINPYKKEYCDYCPYATICRIDQVQKINDADA